MSDPSECDDPRRDAAIRASDWVEIEWTILEPAERTGRLPEDTAALPYVGRCRGTAVHDAELGDVAEIVTLAGRRLTGRVTTRFPSYTHGFGQPFPAWQELRAGIVGMRGRS